jgi:hypothetical protein
MLWKCEAEWIGQARDITNQLALLDQLRHFLSGKDFVVFVTFNYDTIIERAFRGIGVPITSLEDYIKNDQWKLIKLHGSVNWAREIDTSISMVGRGNPYEVAREVIAKADQLQVSDRYRVVTEYPGGGSADTGLLPALTIPVQTKYEFECPKAHTDALVSVLPQIDRMLLIGWRASEKPFLSLLSNGLRPRVRCAVISGNDREARETISNLSSSGIRPSKIERHVGFTRFMLAESLIAFLM